jgi:amino-acid N-acetyltransferase
MNQAFTLEEYSEGLAQRGDLLELKALLGSNALPHDDLDQHLSSLIVVRHRAEIVAVEGVEVHGLVGLIRSVCVREDHRGRGIAARVCELVEQYAMARGVARLYLLTTTAEAFFRHRGFDVCERTELPTEIQQTAQVRSLCPSTAVCMTRTTLRAGSN